MNEAFDVIVIGAGPAGYVAAIRAAQLGSRTAVVDAHVGKDGKASYGGVCLNSGCIPSKALLDSSKLYHALAQRASAHGVHADGLRVDMAELLGRKDRIVKTLTDGVGLLFKANNITPYWGRGSVHLGNKVIVDGMDGVPHSLVGNNIIIATGSVPITLPEVTIDGATIVDHVGALDFSQVPRRLGIIGAGVVGLELGSVWSRLGSHVTLLEASPEFLVRVDADIAHAALREFKKQGLRIELGAQVARARVVGSEVQVVFANAERDHELIVDKLLVSVGRRPLTEGLFQNDVGIEMDERGRIVVDESCATSVPGIWAIGDVVRGPMLAHKGSEEGIAVAERIAGHAGDVDFDKVPRVIYTDPEIAWVGKSENDLGLAGVPYKVGTFTFAALGRAAAMNETAGHVKLLAHAETDRILGAQMVGPGVSELIAEAVLAMELNARSQDIGVVAHAHPSLSEAIREAALAVSRHAITKINR
jgi:dihydrolipoamide dehydrogenase